MKNNIDELAVKTIRSLCIDMTNNAKSGHPGMPLGSAPILYTLYKYHLVANPNVPYWINRDRFVLSSGHASTLLYSLLHLSGYKISLDDLKKFRTLNSITSGHPEFRLTPGVDATSGPLGQGIAQAVGIAIAEKHIASSYKDGELVMNHYTYCLLGDGDLEEGLSQEAISTAGHLGLNKLIVIYDSNDVTLDGPTSLSISDDTRLRFLASNWNVIKVDDGNDIKAINNAINKAKKSKSLPTLIIVKTTIGYGSKNEGTNKVHGAPLGEEDGNFAKKNYKFNYPPFTIPNEVYEEFNKTFIKRGKEAYKQYIKNFIKFRLLHKQETIDFVSSFTLNVDKYLKDDVKFDENLNEATRKTSGNLLNKFAKEIPFVFGGSADVSSSVNTKIKDEKDFSATNPSGKNINFGIREFAMASIQNGMLLHGGLRTYVGSFLVFSDYMKSAIRTASLSHLPAIYLFSHDSIFLGEDGPTHQPIEQLAMLRSIPNLVVFRPCDARETYGAYKFAFHSKHTPTAIILSRQNLPLIKNSSDIKTVLGAYIVSSENSKNFITLIATGSEVKMALEAKEKLKGKVDIRVVSMPSMELFNILDEDIKNKIIPSDKYDKCIAIEALSSFGWRRYALNVMSVDSFGLSAKGDEVAKYIGFTVDNLVKLIMKVKNNGR